MIKQVQQRLTTTSPRTGALAEGQRASAQGSPRPVHPLRVGVDPVLSWGDHRPRGATAASMVEQSVTADLGAARPFQAKSGIWFAVVLTGFEIGASIAIFQYAGGHGASDVGAYLWACLAPLIGAVAYFVRTHDLSGASIAILAFNALSALIAVIGRTDAKMLLYKDSFATGIIGLIFAVSLLFGKPLAYWFGQRFAGGGTHEGDVWWEQMWDSYPLFRRAQRIISVVWAVTLLIEALVKAIIIKLNNYRTAFVWDQILPVVAFAIAMTLTLWIAKRSRAEGLRRREAADRQPPAAD